MRVLHIVPCSIHEGAGRGALWLHRGLLQLGLDSVLLTEKDEPSEENVLSFNQSLTQKVVRAMQPHIDSLPVRMYRNRLRTFFSSGNTGFDITKIHHYDTADIIHLHWVNSGFLAIPSLKHVAKPVIWTIRDMWPMTGGCHYSLGCTKFHNTCGACPQLGSDSPEDLSTQIQAMKRNAFPENIQFVGISNWITLQARQSALLRNTSIATIANNIDVSVFRPGDRLNAKKRFHIDPSQKTILIGASYLDSKFKGLATMKTLRKMIDPSIQFVSFGKLIQSHPEIGAANWRHLGSIQDDSLLAELYRAADIHLSAAPMEAFGKTIAESIACGTPAVCFSETGCADIIDHKETGYIAKHGSTEDLKAGIAWALGPSRTVGPDDFYRRMVDRFSIAAAAKSYKDLYESKLHCD